MDALKFSLGRHRKEVVQCQEYLPDAWDARLHQAVFQAGRNRDLLRSLGYRAQFNLDSCESVVKHGTVTHEYRSGFRLYLAESEYAAVNVNFAVVGANSQRAEIDFPVGFVSFSWEMPRSRRVPLLHVRIWDKADLSQLVNDLYRESRLASGQPVRVSLNLAIDHLADLTPDQCWGPWGEDDDPVGRWPGRASVQLIGYELSTTY